MKKSTILLTAGVLLSSYRAFAGTGNTNDGLLFTLVIVGGLSFLYALLSTIDYLRKNGRAIFITLDFVSKYYARLKELLNRRKTKILQHS